jgi:hypothetical protein
MTLSSSEAEYVAISEPVKEINFIHYLLREIGIEVNLPITVKTDSVSAMFMPSSFDEAWNHDDPKVRGKWRDAIKKKLNDMDKQQVWEIIKKEDIPEDRRTIKCKWIFKIKQNKIFRARLVACEYSQIPGIDFNESFAPVTKFGT